VTQHGQLACYRYMRLGVISLVLVASVPARADPPWDRLDVVVRGAIDRGTGASDGLDLIGIGAGVELRLSSMAQISALGLAVGTDGATADGTRAHGAPGGELALAIVPFPTWWIRPYLRWSGGILVFPGEPFLPGGDGYDFVLHAGAGVTIPLGQRFTLAVHADIAHVSNGQGLGAFNPAFNGIGGGVELAYALAPPVDAIEQPASRDPAGLEVVADGAFGNAQGWLATGRIRAELPMTEHVVAQVDAEAGALADHAVAEAGLDIASEWQHVIVGAHAGLRDYVGLYTGVLQLQAETRITDATSIVGTAIYEPSTYVGSVGAGVGLRVVATPRIAIDVGEGLEHSFGSTTEFAPYFGGEWQLPIALASRARWSLFYERQITGLNELGVRFAYGATATLHGPIWRRLR
jgi:hypothetical protein